MTPRKRMLIAAEKSGRLPPVDEFARGLLQGVQDGLDGKPARVSDAVADAKMIPKVLSQIPARIIIDKGRSYKPLQELLGQGSTQFQFDRPTTIDPSTGHPTAR